MTERCAYDVKQDGNFPCSACGATVTQGCYGFAGITQIEWEARQSGRAVLPAHIEAVREREEYVKVHGRRVPQHGSGPDTINK